MPTASSGLYVATVEQSYLGSQIFNVYGYRQTGGVDDEQDSLATAVDTTIVAAMANIQAQTLLYTNIRVANITGNLADVNLTPTTTAGNVVGDVMADFVSCGFRYNRTTKETRNGSKRFAGMVEQNTQGGSFTGAFNTLLDALAVTLETNVAAGGTAFEPVIIRFPEESPGVFRYNVVSGVQNLNRVTSQNSRKKF